MRTPTNPIAAMGWHRAALKGARQAIYEDEPQPGYYRMNLVKGGPMVPVKIWWQGETDPVTRELVADEVLMCLVDRRPYDPIRAWASCSKHPVSLATYQKMIDLIAWAEANDLTHPVLFPRNPIAPDDYRMMEAKNA